MYQNNFPERLIKGRIAETVFELMFRETKKFEIIPLGYEHVTPQLIQYQHLSPQVHQVIDNIRYLPDFILVTPDKSEVYLVEVKYQKQRNDGEITKIAEKLLERWDPIFLFVATHDAFYLDSCNNIVHHHPQISPLESHWVSSEIQDQYIRLLQEFEI